MAQTSSRVTQLLAILRHLRVTASTHGDRVVPAAADALGLDISALFPVWDAVLARIESAARDLEAAEDAYVAEQADDTGPREARDSARDALADHLRQVRSALATAFGPTTPAAYALDSAMPDAADAVLRRARTSQSLLRSKPHSGAHALFGHVVSTEMLADGLDAPIDALHAALESVKQEESELKGALTDRDEALTAARRTYRVSASLVESFFRAAHEDTLADTVRPTLRRSQGRSTAELPEPPSEPEPSAA